MEFVQTDSRETETSLLHIPPQCSQKDLNDLITGIDNRSQTVEFRTGQGLTDGVVDKSNLRCAAPRHHSRVTYDIISDIMCDWYDISYDIIKGLGKLHLGGYQVAKHKRKVQEQYPDAITRQMLPSMTLDIHVVEVGCILRGHLEERRRRVQR